MLGSYFGRRIDRVVGQVLALDAGAVRHSLFLDMDGLNRHATSGQGLAVVLEAVGVLDIGQWGFLINKDRITYSAVDIHRTNSILLEVPTGIQGIQQGLYFCQSIAPNR